MALKQQNIQTEIDASYLYAKLAEHEPDQLIANVYRQMSEIELSHADAFIKSNTTGNQLNLPAPSFRAKILNAIGKTFGYNFVLGVLMETEKSISKAIVSAKNSNNTSPDGTEHNHVRILQAVLENKSDFSGSHLAKFESRHRSVGGNALRAAVLGGNDGLVSNFSLVMGVAGATEGQNGVLLAGIAGLLAGALSMSLGEWISVKSSQELNENQMQLEMEELIANPEGEIQELALIYMAKGIPEEQAHKMAVELMQDKEKAHEVLVKEELGINVDEIEGSPLEAAIYSFVLFAFGAIIPVFPFFFMQGYQAIVWSVIASTIGLFMIGAAITLFTGKNVWFSGFRQVLFGLVAAAITYGIGSLIGTSLAG